MFAYYRWSRSSGSCSTTIKCLLSIQTTCTLLFASKSMRTGRDSVPDCAVNVQSLHKLWQRLGSIQLVGDLREDERDGSLNGLKYYCIITTTPGRRVLQDVNLNVCMYEWVNVLIERNNTEWIMREALPPGSAFFILVVIWKRGSLLLQDWVESWNGECANCLRHVEGKILLVFWSALCFFSCCLFKKKKKKESSPNCVAHHVAQRWTTFGFAFPVLYFVVLSSAHYFYPPQFVFTVHKSGMRAKWEHPIVLVCNISKV